MRCVQARQLFHHPEQKKTQGKTADEKALQVLQKTHIAQRDEISFKVHKVYKVNKAIGLVSFLRA